MPIFVSILEGPTVHQAEPLLVTRDPVLIALLRRELSKRLTEQAITDRLVEQAEVLAGEPSDSKN